MNVATIIAIVLGPILAVQVQKLIERLRDKKQTQRSVFIGLMTFRAQRLSPEFVKALNLIDLAFSGKRKTNRAVVAAWNKYRTELTKFPERPPCAPGTEYSQAENTQYEAKCDEWVQRIDDLVVDLLQKMGKVLGHDFDVDIIKRGAYIPRYYADRETQQEIIMRGFTDIILGRRGFPVTPYGLPDPAPKPVPKKESDTLL